MNLIYSCVFYNDSYLSLLRLLLQTYRLQGPREDTHYMVMTSSQFAPKVRALDDRVDVWVLDDIETVFDAACSRLLIFEYPKIGDYSKILYLDTDILITNHVHPLFDIQLENVLYTLEEGPTDHPFWGGEFFPKDFSHRTGFTSGILLFNHCDAIRSLFQKVREHIDRYLRDGHVIPPCYDQPFLNYWAIKECMCENQWLIGKAVNNPVAWNKEIIAHFPGEPGNSVPHYLQMINYIMTNSIDIQLHDIVSLEEYTAVLDANRHILDRIKQICLAHGELVEGNCFTEHHNIHHEMKDLINKQANHYSLGRVCTSIMEIGFNAGHSTLLYLLSNPSCHVTIFDICSHAYTMPCFNYLSTLFPGRLDIHPGDSTVTIPKYIKDNPGAHFHLIHIDGSHEESIARQDLENSMRLAQRYIIWDDTQMSHLNQMFDDTVKAGLFREVVDLHPTYTYQHRIAKIM